MGDRESVKAAVLKAKARSGNENIAKFALSAAGVSCDDVKSNLSQHRLTKAGPLKVANGKGK